MNQDRLDPQALKDHRDYRDMMDGLDWLESRGLLVKKEAQETQARLDPWALLVLWDRRYAYKLKLLF